MSLYIIKLTCNYLKNPLGVDSPKPKFSWMIESSIRCQVQTAYRITCASSEQLLKQDKADLWDSGIVKTDKSVLVEYGGKKLKSRQLCFWQVRVWDKFYKPHISSIAYFEMGILEQSEWIAKWICSPFGYTNKNKSVNAPLFRKTLSLSQKVECARAYICGLGIHEFYINGNKIGDEVLSPAFTRYDKTSLYNTYDISHALQIGENVIGIELGNGFYNSFTVDTWNHQDAIWRHTPKLIAQIYIKTEDGKEQTVLSDQSFKVAKGPVIFDGIRNGEYYDTRLEKTNWTIPGFDDKYWRKAKITASPGGELRSSQHTPIKVTATLKPISITEVAPNVFVYDLGQNISGWAQIRVSGKAGTKLKIRYAERLNNDGTVNQEHIRMFVYSGAFQTDMYILKGEGVEVWEPKFTYHGFQYIQVSGTDIKLSLENVCGRVVHTAFDKCGDFNSSNDLLNKIHLCSVWSTKTNFHGLPTDCPHREKLGWTGDALLSAEHTLMNFNPMTSYTKWLQDFKDSQRPSGQLPAVIPSSGFGYNWGSGPAWDSALILIPWYMYQYCGDTSILESTYDCMKKYINFLSTLATNHIIDYGLGDWNPPTGGNFNYKCPTAITDTAYYYTDTLVVSKISYLLGKKKESKELSNLASNIRKAFRKKFFNPKTAIVKSNCQTSLACALYHGLIDNEEKLKVLEQLIDQIKKPR